MARRASRGRARSDARSVDAPLGDGRHGRLALWRIPDLRGRIAYDVRFELYDAETIDRIARYGRRDGPDWASLTDGYDVVIVDDGAHRRAHLAIPGSRVVYQDNKIAVIS